MIGRRVTTTITMLALVLVLGVMAVWGFKEATKPVRTSPSGEASCSKAETSVRKVLARQDIQVSVYNASTRKGLATQVLARFEALGFDPGEAGNAPGSVKVVASQVMTNQADDQAAQLVAKTLGKGTQVVRTDDEMGPGVDVIVGQSFRRLNPAAPRTVRLAKPQQSCIKVG